MSKQNARAERGRIDWMFTQARARRKAVVLITTEEPHEANAHLIAAAPDGYALALEVDQWAKDRNMECVPPESGTGKMIANARALIAKVERS